MRVFGTDGTTINLSSRQFFVMFTDLALPVSCFRSRATVSLGDFVEFLSVRLTHARIRNFRDVDLHELAKSLAVSEK